MFPNGAAVYLPSATYKISLAQSCSNRGGAIAIRQSNIRLFGDGDSSTLYAPTWEDHTGCGSTLIQAYVMVGDDQKSISGVRVENFQFLGPDGPGSSNDTSALNAVQLGVPILTHIVTFSGVRGMFFQGTGAHSAVLLNGGENPDQGSLQAIGNYVLDNRFYSLAGQAIACESGGHTDTIVSRNKIRSPGPWGGAAIEWGGSRVLITDNTISNGAQSAIALEQESSQVG